MNMSWTASVQMQVDVRMFLFLTASVKARPLKNYRQSSDNKSMHHFPTRKAEWCGLIFCTLHFISPVLSSVSVSHCHFTVPVLPKYSGWKFIAADQTDEGLLCRILVVRVILKRDFYTILQRVVVLLYGPCKPFVMHRKREFCITIFNIFGFRVLIKSKFPIIKIVRTGLGSNRQMAY